MACIYISLGSNKGDRSGLLRQAVRFLTDGGISITKQSAVYETEPWGNKNQNWFLNCCVEAETAFSPEEVLKIAQNIEQKLGRLAVNDKQKAKWGPRTIDIDLLLYDDLILDTPRLGIPHKELHNRRFVLAPLAEVAPDFWHPILKKSIKDLLSECEDNAIVRAAHG